MRSAAALNALVTDAAHGLLAAPCVAVARRSKTDCRPRPDNADARSAEAEGTPIAGILPFGPSNHIVEWMWSWPCRTSSTPCCFSSAQQLCRIGQPLDARIRVQGMMHQQHAKAPARRTVRASIAFERIELGAAEPAGRHQGRRRHRRGHADQRQRSAPAQRTETARRRRRHRRADSRPTRSAKRCRVART